MEVALCISHGPLRPPGQQFVRERAAHFGDRKENFLFVGHEEAKQNLAILQTITSTCRLHNVDAYEYIKDVLIRIQTHPVSKIDELLPQNWSRATPDSE